MIVAEEAIRMATGRVSSPLEFWGCTNSPRYHTDRLRTYRTYPNKMDPYMAEHAKLLIKEYARRN